MFELTARDPDGQAEDGSQLEAGDVWVTQYLAPDARTRLLRAPVGEEYAAKCEQYRMILTSEVLRLQGNTIVLYARLEDWEDEDEMILTALNQQEPGHPSGPVSRLRELIDMVLAKAARG